jgi:hypothetical protein
MRVGVLGTGGVGQTLAAKIGSLSHQVIMGTRDVQAALARKEAGWGAEPLAEWQAKHQDVKLGTFAEAAAHGELVINATAGIVGSQSNAPHAGGPSSLARAESGRDSKGGRSKAEGRVRPSASVCGSVGSALGDLLPVGADEDRLLLEDLDAGLAALHAQLREPLQPAGQVPVPVAE